MVSNSKAETHSAHIEDLKNPIQLQPPARDLSLPITRSKVFNQFILAGQLVDLSLYLPNTPVVGNTVGRGLKVYIAGSTHISNRLIALRTDSLSSSALFPSVPRLSASQTSPQSMPRSTQSCSLTILS